MNGLWGLYILMITIMRNIFNNRNFGFIKNNFVLNKSIFNFLIAF